MRCFIGWCGAGWCRGSLRWTSAQVRNVHSQVSERDLAHPGSGHPAVKLYFSFSPSERNA